MKKGKWKWLAISLAIIYVVLGVFSIINYGPFATLSDQFAYDNDDSKYIRAADTFLKTGTLTYNYVDQPTAFIMPGIIFALTPFVALFGEQGSVLGFKIFQLILQVFCLYLVWLIAKKMFDKRVALVAVIVSVFYFADYYALNVILTEVIFKTLLLTLVLFTLQALESHTVKNYILAAVFWSIAALFRPTIAAYPLIVLIIWLVKRFHFTYILNYSALVAGIFVVLLSPWWIRNYAQFGEFIPFTASTGDPMFLGTYINYEEHPEEEALLDYSTLQMPENYENLYDEFKNNIKETAMAKYRLETLVPLNPAGYAHWYTIGKTLYQWRMPFVWRPVLNLTLAQIFAEHLLIVFFFLSGLVLALLDKRKNASWLFLALIPLYYNCIHLPFYAFSRYIYPAMPIVIMFASYSSIRIYDGIKHCIKYITIRQPSN
ncbi:hypothetical protein FACS189425_00170 [Clostridia bacterium]|nr:hypothetical protein FACS189425_00170 [Clostridia bacterium]